MHAPNTEVRNNFKTVQQESPAIDDKLHDACAYVPRFRYEIKLLLNKYLFILLTAALWFSIIVNADKKGSDF